jgi:NAD(P)-dependent dehydrogenase (short-subunit alcohol dehydrogenase family)
MARLHDKTCVVTAAAQGIGRAIAEAFASEGAQVIAVDRNASVLGAWTAGTGITAVTLDATDEGAVQSWAAGLGRVDVLANCVGMVPDGTILATAAADLERCFRVNVVSMHLMTQALLPQMLERRQGSIINIASVVSSLKAAPNRYAYATTKAAVIGLTRAIARDFIANGVRCNAICPGTVESPSLQERIAAKGNAEQARADFIARQPMGRLGNATEIAAIAVLLASDEACFMSGENIVIDGGMSL